MSVIMQFFAFMGTRVIDLVALFANLGSVGALALNRKWLGWILGLIGSVALLVIYWQNGFVFDVTLMVYYIITSFVGMALWAVVPKSREKKELAITDMPRRHWKWITVFTVLFTAFFGWLVLRLGFTELGNFVYVDAFTTALSIAAQWMLARKWYQNWHVWILADVVDIWLYATKGLPFVAVLVTVYLFQCVFALWNWTRIRRQQDADQVLVLESLADPVAV